MANKPIQKDFVGKADRLLRWATKAHLDLLTYGKTGDLDDIERSFFCILTYVAVLHEAIASAAAELKLYDWRREINRLRHDEPLLRYFWLARNSDIHDAVIKWAGGVGVVQVQVVDASKAHSVSRQFYSTSTHAEDLKRLFRYLYEVQTFEEVAACVKRRVIPTPERLDSAGVSFQYAIEGITLKAFICRVNGKDELIPEPTNHFGNLNATAEAHASAEAVLKFYSAKLDELKMVVGQTKAPVSAQDTRPK